MQPHAGHGHDILLLLFLWIDQGMASPASPFLILPESEREQGEREAKPFFPDNRITSQFL